MGTYAANILPNANGLDLGSPGQRWDAFIRDLSITGTLAGPITLSSGDFLPANGNTTQSLGSSLAPWNAVLNTATVTSIATKKFNNIRYADQFTGATADVQINAAIVDLPSTGGIVDCRGYGATTQNIAATVNVGTTTQTVTLILDRGTNFQTTITNTTPAWHLSEGSAIYSMGEVPSANTNGGLSASNTANISNMVLIDSGATGNFTLENLQILPSASAIVSDAVVKIVNGSGAIRGLTVQGYLNTTLLKITQTAGQFVGPINLDNLQINGGGSLGCKPVVVQAVGGGGVMLGINFLGGSFTHPGLGGTPIVDLEGITGNDLAGTNFYGCQFESSNAADIGILINNTGAVRIHDCSFTNSGSPGTDCIKITGGNTTGIEVTGLNNFGNWTNNINNVPSGRVITNANNKMASYSFSFSGASNANDYVWDDATGNIAVMDTNGLALSGSKNIALTTGNLTMAGGNLLLDSGSKLTKYNSINTAGNGAVVIHASTSQKSESAADTNVLTFTPPAAAGTYRIAFTMAVSAQNTATLGWTATWKDSNGAAQAPTNLSLFTSGTAAPALTVTAATNGNYYGTAIVDIDNSATNIVVKLTFTGTSFTAKASANIERLV